MDWEPWEPDESGPDPDALPYSNLSLQRREMSWRVPGAVFPMAILWHWLAALTRFLKSR